MYNKSFIYAVAVGTAMAVTTNASAEILSPTVVDFGYKPDRNTPDTVLKLGAYYSKGNLTPIAGGNCPGEDSSNQCVYQNGMVISTVEDASGPDAHLHQGGSTTNRAIAYHNDSGGVYIRAQDSTAFSLESIKFISPPSGENPYAIGGTGGHESTFDFFEILGFSEAVNSDLAAIDPYADLQFDGDGLPILSTYNPFDAYSNLVAYQTVENGVTDLGSPVGVSTVFLNADFQNVKSVWIHYFLVPNVGEAGFPFKTQLDDISVNAVAAVPVPAAAWLFGTGLLGVLSAGRKKASKV